MKLRAAVPALVLPLVLSVAPGSGAPAAAAGDLPIDRTDPSGDVTVYDGGGTKPTTGQRKTIDLRRFTVEAHGSGLRFTFRIARIAAGRTFDQVVQAQLRRPGRGSPVLDLQANPQQGRGTAFYRDELCVTDVTASRRTATVRVDLPRDCVPTEPGVLRASTYLQDKNGSGPGFSEDTLRVPGTVELR